MLRTVKHFLNLMHPPLLQPDKGIQDNIDHSYSLEEKDSPLPQASHLLFYNRLEWKAGELTI